MNDPVNWEDEAGIQPPASMKGRPGLRSDTPQGRCETVLSIINKHLSSEGGLMLILEDIQGRFGYLPAEALRIVSAGTGRSLVDIYGVATFYRFFTLKPRGNHLCSVCVGTACHVRGALKVAKEMERQLRIHPGETTADREFTLETVNCLGACALGPIVVVDGHYFSNVNAAGVGQVLDKAREVMDETAIRTDQRIFPLEVGCPRCNHTLMDAGHPINGYPSIRVTMSFGREHGWLRLSSLYGDFNVESEYEIPMDTLVNFFCPHCHAELLGAAGCPECGTPMVPMIVRNGGVIQICSRRGCRGHMLDLNGGPF